MAKQNQDFLDRVLNLSIEHWNKRFVGISSLDAADEIGLENEQLMELTGWRKTRVFLPLPTFW